MNYRSIFFTLRVEKRNFIFGKTFEELSDLDEAKQWWMNGGLGLITCSALRPGGHQAYSSKAQPESSSLFDRREFCWNIVLKWMTIRSCSREFLERTREEINLLHLFNENKTNDCIRTVKSFWTFAKDHLEDWFFYQGIDSKSFNRTTTRNDRTDKEEVRGYEYTYDMLIKERRNEERLERKKTASN